jgi:Taurine catabolism dioxygenase TauD, TfdA family
VEAELQQLGQSGFAWIRDSFVCAEEAREFAGGLIDARCAEDGVPELGLIGNFLLPPPDGERSREFQTLHFDFGVPLDPKVQHDVGRFTALHIPNGFGAVSAVTRLVPLTTLLGQRAWPLESELEARLIAYGKTHGAWNDDQGYVEGSLARVVEAAAGVAALPSVKMDSGFLCGMEFANLESELRFFEGHSLRVEDVQIEVLLSPGEMLVFDNLALAHGRRGARRPGELHQWVFGERGVGAVRQRELRSRVLEAFAAAA